MTPHTAGRRRDMLTATFQWQDVPPNSGNALKRISKRPKGHIRHRPRLLTPACFLAPGACRPSSVRHAL